MGVQGNRGGDPDGDRDEDATLGAGRSLMRVNKTRIKTDLHLTLGEICVLIFIQTLNYISFVGETAN